MKKTILAIMAGLIFTLAFNVETNGQTIASSKKSKLKLPTLIQSTEASGTISNLLSRENIPPKAVKDFKKNYKVDNEKWIKTTDGFVTLIKSPSGNTNTYYNKKGNRTFTMKTYEEKDLRKDIRTRVKREYLDHKILLVHEILQNEYQSEPTYLILINQDKDYKWIKINADGMNIYNEFTTTD